MRQDLATIVSSLINNINAARYSTGSSCGGDNLLELKFLSEKTVSALEKLRDTWPNLTEEEIKELNATIMSVEAMYNYTEEDIEKYEAKRK